MARAKKDHPQAVAPYLTQHSADPDWPLTVIVDERGQSRHACADCGEEIPDGLRVERVEGRVVAFQPVYAVPEQMAPLVLEDGSVTASRMRVEVDRTVFHDCGASRG